MAKRRWSDLSSGQQAVAVVGGVVQVGLQAAVLWDLSQRPTEQVRGPKAMWVALSFVNFAGPIAYAVLGRQPRPAPW